MSKAGDEAQKVIDQYRTRMIDVARERGMELAQAIEYASRCIAEQMQAGAQERSRRALQRKPKRKA